MMYEQELTILVATVATIVIVSYSNGRTRPLKEDTGLWKKGEMNAV